MARSQYIYVVIDPGQEEPAPFTVKHELITWLSRQPEPNRMIIWRCQDGIYKTNRPSRITLQELGL